MNRSASDLDGVLRLLPPGVKSNRPGDLLGVFVFEGVRPKDSLFSFFTTPEKLDVLAGLLLPDEVPFKELLLHDVSRAFRCHLATGILTAAND
jgi:hypothetical protein